MMVFSIPNVRNDINATKIEDSGELKTIFAGEAIKVERKFKNAEFYAPKAKHIFNANWLPRVVGEDEAIHRRVLIVEFPESVPREVVGNAVPPYLVESMLSSPTIGDIFPRH